MHIANTVIAIYGGTSGIGKQLTIKLVDLGAYVIITGRNKNNGKTLENELNATRHSAVYYQCDITDDSSHERLYKLALERFQQSVDVVIVVAGMLESSGLTSEIEENGMQKTIVTNLIAAIKASQFAIRHFLRNNKPGCIINTSSIYGFCGAPLAPLYAASKHGINGWTKSYGCLLRDTDIRVNAVAPHFVDTPMIQAESSSVINAFGKVPIESCIEAYHRIITDDTLNGDIVSVTTTDVVIEPRYTDTTHEQLDILSKDRKKAALEQLKKHFA